MTTDQNPTTARCRPAPGDERYHYHWLKFMDHDPEPWVWSTQFNEWLSIPWHSKSAPNKPNGGWCYLGPAFPPAEIMNAFVRAKIAARKEQP